MSLLAGVTSAISSIPVPKAVQKAFLETAKEGPNAILPLEGAVIVGRSAAAAKRGGFMEFQERFLEESVVAVVWLWGVTAMQKVFDKFSMPMRKSIEHLSPEIAWKKLGKGRTVDLAAQEMFTKNAGEINKLLKIKGLRWLFSVGTIVFTVAILIPWLNQKKTDWIIRREEAKKGLAPTPGAPQASTTAATVQQTPVPAGPQAFAAPGATHFNGQSLFNQSIAQPARPARNPGFDGQGTVIGQPGQALNALSSNTAFPAAVPAFGRQAASVPVSPKFGGMGMGALQALGHAVEQTPYGSLLVVDTGITGGRGIVAAKRSIFETTEIVFRDAVSLYFYIMFAPHMMKALSAVIDPVLGTSLKIEPKVAEMLHQQMWARANAMAASNPELKAALAKGELPVEALKEIIHGAPHKALGATEGILRTELRTASTKDFSGLLQKEASAYLGNAEAGAKATQAVTEFLSSRATNVGNIATDDLAQLLGAVSKGEGAFAELAAGERANLSTAVRQAYRHTVGLPVEMSEAALKKMDIFKPILQSNLPQAEKDALVKRALEMAHIDGLDQANTMLRRSLNLGRGELDAKLITRIEANADILDKAVNRGLSLGDLFRHEAEGIQSKLGKLKLSEASQAIAKDLGNASVADLSALQEEVATLSGRSAKKVVEQLGALTEVFSNPKATAKAADLMQDELMGSVRELTAHAEASGNAKLKSLVSHYGKEAAELISGAKGRLFSLFIESHDAGVTDKITELTRGGLQYDTQFIKRAQDIVGHLTSDSRKYTDPGKQLEMRKHVAEYAEKMMAYADKNAAKAEKGISVPGAEKLLTNFFKLNQRTHYFSRIVAMGGAMLFLGIIVPKLQYALTRKLTGKNEHPGIAKAAGHGKPAAAPHGAAPAMPSQLNRQNFQAFQRTV